MAIGLDLGYIFHTDAATAPAWGQTGPTEKDDKMQRYIIVWHTLALGRLALTPNGGWVFPIRFDTAEHFSSKNDACLRMNQMSISAPRYEIIPD